MDMNIKLPIALLVSLLVSSTLFAQSAEDQLKSIRTSIEEMLVEAPPDAETVENYVKQQGADGRWPDIDYACQNRASWSVMGALGRSMEMARAYRAPGHPLHGDKRLSRAVDLAIGDWMKNRYRNPNWWFASIGIPQLMGRIGLLMEGHVKPEVFDFLKGAVGRTRPKGKGQNLIWISECVMYGGLLRREYPTVENAVRYIRGTIAQGEGGGVQYDWSYHLHGPQNQLGVYGSGFATDQAKNAYIFRGTSCAFDADQLAILRGFLLKGIGWIIWNGAIDANCIGRCVSRKGANSSYTHHHRTFELMSEVDPDHKADYLKFLNRNRDGGANNLVGNKHFWRSDFMVHRAKDWYASVRMCSTRTIGGESSNDENLRGYFAADGVLLLYVTGREYEEIFPVWDWRRLPGLTCIQTGVPPTQPKRLKGTTTFVGGVSDGKAGISVLDYNRSGLAAHKSWFFLEDAVVCLGAGIKSDEAHPVTTAINQCRLNGDVVEEANWYWHDAIGYHLLSDHQVECQHGPRKGRWTDITAATQGEPDEVEMDVFSLSIEHGTKPQNESYSYVVYPGITADEMPSKVQEKKILVLKNRTDIQAVYDTVGKQHMVAFWKAGSIELGNKKTLKADNPCLVMLEETGGAPLLSISDPTQTLQAINIELTGFKPLPIKLPAAPHRGDSLDARFSPL